MSLPCLLLASILVLLLLITFGPVISKADSEEVSTFHSREEDRPLDQSFPPDLVRVLRDVDFESITQATTGGTTGDWLILFYADWCQHCQHLQPIWLEVAKSLTGQINVAKIDSMAELELSQRFGISSFPSIIYVSSGSYFLYPSQKERTADSLVSWSLLMRNRDLSNREENQEVPVPIKIPRQRTLSDRFHSWAVSLNQLLIDSPLVAVSLLLLGALIGVAFTIVGFWFTLGNTTNHLQQRKAMINNSRKPQKRE